VKGVFRLPAYRRLLTAYTLTQLAYLIGSLTLTVLVYRRTGSAVAAAGYFLCAEFAPSLVTPLIVARIAGRPARRLLPLLALAEAAVFCVLGALTGGAFVLPLVLALTLIDGVIALLARTVARTATVAVLDPVGLLPEGNAVTNAAFTVCLLAGPALGGVVVAAGGIRVTLFVVAAALALIALLLAVRAQQLPGAAPAPPEAEAGWLRAAVRHLRERPALRRMLLLQAVAILFFTVPMPVEIVYVRRSLHETTRAYGVLLALWGAGAIVGSAVYARWRRFPARVLIPGGTLFLAAGFLVMAAAQRLDLALAGAVSCGIGNGIVAVAVRTTLQGQVEEGWMALMMGLSESTNQAMPGAGIVLGGALTALAGPRAALAVAGGGALAVAAMAWFILAPALLGTRDSAPAGEPEPVAAGTATSPSQPTP
jgi:MFS family permease